MIRGRLPPASLQATRALHGHSTRKVMAGMRRQAPPLEAIEAFILATRSSSFRDAADRLALSPSAFSRRIQALEAFVGVPLFIREKGTATLSSTGERYLRTIEPAIDAIRRATVDLQAERGGLALRVVVPQSFAIAWLIPRLAEFQKTHPHIRIELKVGRAVSELKRGHADLAILVGPGETAGMPSTKLTQLKGVLVAAPVMMDGTHPPRGLMDLPAYPRLAVYQPEGIWERWLSAAGYCGEVLERPTYYEAQFLMLEAAAAGMGIALTPPLLVHRLIEAGRLVQPLPDMYDIGVDYSLVYADDAVRRRPDALVFAAWLSEGIAVFDRWWSHRLLDSAA